jgi:TolA-binding protein
MISHHHVCSLLLAAALAAGGGLFSSPAQAALFGDDEARKAILDLRGRLAEQDKRAQETQATLNQRLDAAQRSQLELVNQIEALRQEIAKLRGQNDTLANELANLQKRSRDLYGDLDTRLKSLEPVQVTIDGKPVSMGRDEQGAYDAALAVFRGGDFAGAVRAFQGFLLRYPASAHAASARYWTGSALYAQKDYRNAIAEQQIVVDKHPASPRAPAPGPSGSTSTLRPKAASPAPRAKSGSASRRSCRSPTSPCPAATTWKT